MATTYRVREAAWPQSSHSSTHPHRRSRRPSTLSAAIPAHIATGLQMQISRTESQRREEQMRLDEAIAAREQAEEERLLFLYSMRTAEQHRRSVAQLGNEARANLSSTTSSSSPGLKERLDVPPEQENRSSKPVAEPVPNLDIRRSLTPQHSSTPQPSVYPSATITTSTRTASSLPLNEIPSSTDEAQELRRYSSLFTRSLNCSQCNTEIILQPMLDGCISKQLHLTCKKCRVTHCRGCARPVDCAPNCDVSRSPCCLRNCCRKGRAIAIFEILGHFDKKYATASERLSKSDTWPVPHSERRDFLRFVTSNGDSRVTKPFNDSLRDTLEAVQSWLPLDKRIHDSVYFLLSTSFLLEVVRAYLKDSTKSRINWVIYGELYVEIMNILKLLSRQPRHRDLVMDQHSAIQTSSGLHSLLWDDRSEWVAATSRPDRKSLYALVDSKDTRADLKKLRERLRNPESQEFISQFSMDLQHLVCLNVLA